MANLTQTPRITYRSGQDMVIELLEDVRANPNSTRDFIKSRHAMPLHVWRSAVKIMTRTHGGSTPSTYTWDGKLPELEKHGVESKTASAFLVCNKQRIKITKIMAGLKILTKWQPAARKFLEMR